MIGLGTGLQTSQQGIALSVVGLPGASTQGGGGTPANALTNKSGSLVLTNKSGSLILTRKAA